MKSLTYRNLKYLVIKMSNTELSSAVPSILSSAKPTRGVGILTNGLQLRYAIAIGIPIIIFIVIHYLKPLYILDIYNKKAKVNRDRYIKLSVGISAGALVAYYLFVNHFNPDFGQDKLF
jgi:hypothetical protein